MVRKPSWYGTNRIRAGSKVGLTCQIQIIKARCKAGCKDGVGSRLQDSARPPLDPAFQKAPQNEIVSAGPFEREKEENTEAFSLANTALIMFDTDPRKE